MAWYRDWFDSDAYELVYRERNLDDARRLLGLVERAARPEPGATLLDVACGRGRHSRLLAARGYRVTGLDLAPRAIATARRRAEAEGVSVDFRVADMRELPFEADFDGVLNLFTSFGYFETDAEHQAALDGMARALHPGGFLVQDFLNPEYVLDRLVPEDTRTTHVEGIGTVEVHQTRWLSDDGDRLNKQIRLCCFDHGTGEPDEHTFTESVRLYRRADFEALHARAGLAVGQVFGDYDGGAFGPASPRLILFSRRPSEP